MILFIAGARQSQHEDLARRTIRCQVWLASEGRFERQGLEVGFLGSEWTENKQCRK